MNTQSSIHRQNTVAKENSYPKREFYNNIATIQIVRVVHFSWAIRKPYLIYNVLTHSPNNMRWNNNKEHNVIRVIQKQNKIYENIVLMKKHSNNSQKYYVIKRNRLCFTAAVSSISCNPKYYIAFTASVTIKLTTNCFTAEIQIINYVHMAAVLLFNIHTHSSCHDTILYSLLGKIPNK